MSTVLGIDLGGSAIKWTVSRADAEFAPVETRPTPSSPEEIVEAIRGIVDAAREPHAGAGTDPADGDSAAEAPRALCLGTPGLVDDQGHIRGAAANLPGWGNRPVGEILSEALDIPVTVQNDTTLALFAEYRAGSARDARNVVGVFIGTGIGGGLCLDGEVYLGHRNLAGEIGHVTVVPNGAPCGCGRRGCLERYAAAVGLRRVCRELAPAYSASERRPESPLAARVKADPGTLTTGEILEAEDEGDPLASAVIGQAGEMMARALGSVINTLAPELIVFGGGVMEGGPALMEATRLRLPPYVLADALSGVSFTTAPLGPGAGAIGAALYAREAWER
jgi:glucokinase